MKKILITIIVFIFGVIVIPTNAEAIIVNDKKITFEEFVLGEGELSIDDDLYSYTLRESDDFFYIEEYSSAPYSYYKVKFDGTYTSVSEEEADANIIFEYGNCDVNVVGTRLIKQCYNGNNPEPVETTLTPEVTFDSISVDQTVRNYASRKIYKVLEASINGDIKYALIDNDGNFIIDFTDSFICDLTNEYFMTVEGFPQEEESYNFLDLDFIIRNYDGEEVYSLDDAALASRLNVDANEGHMEIVYLNSVGNVHYFDIAIGSGDTDTITNRYIYSSDGNIFEIPNIQALEDVYLEVNNNKGVFIFEHGDVYSVTDLKGNIKLNNLTEAISHSYSTELAALSNAQFNLLFVIKEDTLELYDYDFNKIYTFEEGTDVDDVSMDVFPKTNGNLANGKYLLDTYVTENDEITHKFILMTIANADKIDLDGKLVDSEGNDLGDKTVELHSEVKTTVTDGLGQFNFTDVIEGEHTLSVIDKDGNVIASSKVSFIPGTTTKVENNVVTYKNSIDELSIKVKLEGTDLIIMGVEEGLTNIEIKPEVEEPKVEANPKTADTIGLFVILSILALTGVSITLRTKNEA